MIASFVETNNGLLLLIVANCKLTLATIAFFFLIALDELIKLKWTYFFFLLNLKPFDFIIFEKASIVIFDYPVNLFDFELHLLVIWQ